MYVSVRVEKSSRAQQPASEQAKVARRKRTCEVGVPAERGRDRRHDDFEINLRAEVLANLPG